MGRIVPDTMENNPFIFETTNQFTIIFPLLLVYTLLTTINITINHHGKGDNLCRESLIVFVARKPFSPTSSQDPRSTLLEAGGLWIGFIKRPNLYPQR